MEHRTVDLAGPTHVLEAGGEGPPIVLVHGLDGSAANWLDVAGLQHHGRVLAVDLPGFGRSPLAGRAADVHSSAALVVRLVEEVAGAPAILIGNSMGAVVTLLAAARAPALVRGVVLAAPAVPRAGRSALDATFAGLLLPYAIPGLAASEPARRARQPAEARVRSLLDLCYADGRRESAAAYAEMVDVAGARDADDARDAWVAASRSLFVELARRGRFHRQADAVPAPVLVVEGGADPVIPARSIHALRERHPDWDHAVLAGVGHVPQLEDPEGFVAAVGAWLAELPTDLSDRRR